MKLEELINAGWSIEKEEGHDRLQKNFKLKNFDAAVAFFNKVAEEANKQNHHPELHLNWNIITVKTWTHTSNDVTEKDYKLAEACDIIVKNK